MKGARPRFDAAGWVRSDGFVWDVLHLDMLLTAGGVRSEREPVCQLQPETNVDCEMQVPAHNHPHARNAAHGGADRRGRAGGTSDHDGANAHADPVRRFCCL